MHQLDSHPWTCRADGPLATAVHSLRARQAALLLAPLLLWSAASMAAVDVNRANAQELEQIKGIGTATAQRIITERARGLFESLEHLSERLSGIGPKTVLKLRAGGLCAVTAQTPCAVTQTAALDAVSSRRHSAGARRHVTGATVTPEILQIP